MWCKRYLLSYVKKSIILKPLSEFRKKKNMFYLSDFVSKCFDIIEHVSTKLFPEHYGAKVFYEFNPPTLYR